jgi:sialic acid synthase SpsE
VRIGPHDTADEVLIVAEIGNNHEGNAKLAGELVHLAADSGADAVKLQTFRTEHYVSPADPARFQRLKGFELPRAEWARLAGIARERGLLFLSTPFDLESVAVLAPLVDAFKVASGDLTFFPLLERVAACGKPVILSTGASDLEEVQETFRFVAARLGPAAELAVLHCTTCYPASPDEVNLAAIPLLAAELGCTVGYSDHTVGIEAAPLAVALGARIIEKHFTIDTHYSEFRDHQLSADPGMMRALVERVRIAERMRGRPEKRVQPGEAPMVALVRRSISAARDLPAGHRVALEDLTWLRPAGGLAPGREETLVGKVLRRAVSAGERLALADVD